MWTNIILFAGTQKDVGVDLVKSLHNTKYTVDEKLNKSSINLFSQKSSNIKELTNGDDDHVNHGNLIEPMEELDTVDSDDESDDDSEETRGSRLKDNKSTLAENKIEEEREFHEGRVRRKAVFGNESELDDQEVMLVIIVLIIISFHSVWISNSNHIMEIVHLCRPVMKMRIQKTITQILNHRLLMKRKKRKKNKI